MITIFYFILVKTFKRNFVYRYNLISIKIYISVSLISSHNVFLQVSGRIFTW